MKDGKEMMPLIDHLTELRKRVIWILVALVVTMVGGFYAATFLLNYLKSVYPASAVTWNALAPFDGIRVYMQCAFMLAMVVMLPFAMYHIWAFVKPGLRARERQAALHYIPLAIVFFLLGLVFAYFVVFMMAFRFTSEVNQNMGLTETYGVSQYFSFLFNIVLPVSLLFELPLVVMFLTKLHILNPARLRKMRKFAYLALVIAGIVITPPDFISDILVIVPLVTLYELSLLLSGIIYRKRIAREAASGAVQGSI
ncbi:MAG: twin-arginine translocase subunit TatC [Paenibacillaceae bacterium]|nr:twin-arginine translocase subunit TatC [Paenibacillaceae bacterium]